MKKFVAKVIAGAAIAITITACGNNPAEMKGNGGENGAGGEAENCRPRAAAMAKTAAETRDSTVVVCQDCVIDENKMADSAEACGRRNGRWNTQDANCVGTAGLPHPENDEVSRGDIVSRVIRLEGVKPTTGYPKESGQYSTDAACFDDNGIEDNLAYDVNYASCFRDVYSPQSETFVFARFPTVKRENLRVDWRENPLGNGNDEFYAHLFHCLQANGTEGNCELSGRGWAAYRLTDSPDPTPCANGVCRDSSYVIQVPLTPCEIDADSCECNPTNPGCGTSILETPRVVPPTTDDPWVNGCPPGYSATPAPAPVRGMYIYNLRIISVKSKIQQHKEA